MSVATILTRPTGHAPYCRACRWEGKPQAVPSRARGALRNHSTSRRHRRAVLLGQLA